MLTKKRIDFKLENFSLRMLLSFYLFFASFSLLKNVSNIKKERLLLEYHCTTKNPLAKNFHNKDDLLATTNYHRIFNNNNAALKSQRQI